MYLSLQDGTETDVDCGGLACFHCAAGRVCQYTSDCSQAGSTTNATVYSPGTTMIVCSATSLVCTDLRAGLQAYNASQGVPVPSFVAFNVTVTSFPPFQFSGAVVIGVDGEVSGMLNRLTLPLVTPMDVLVLRVRP